MAAFSVGKLDAICARLKSTQQPHSAPGSSGERGRSQDVAEGGATVAVHDSGQPNKPTIRNPRENGALKLNEVSTEKLPREAPENGQRNTAVPEKIKVQSEYSEAIEHKGKDGIIINKRYNNNNVAEATDYNNEIDSSSESTTFHTADSTTANADSVVSSTTAEPVLCNEDIPAAQTNCIPTSPLVSYSNPKSTLNPEANLLVKVCPSSSSLSSSTSAIVSPNCTISLQEKKSFNEQNNDVPDVTQSDTQNNYKDNNSEADNLRYQRVTSTQSMCRLPHGNSIHNGFSTSSCSPPLPRNSLLAPSPISDQVPVNADNKNKHTMLIVPEKINPTNSFCETFVLHNHKSNKSFEEGHKFDNKLEINSKYTVDLIHPENNLFTRNGKCAGILDISSSNENSVIKLNTDDEEPAPNTSVRYDQNSPAPMPTGRRKSRKCAKPQKQVNVRLYTEQTVEFGNPDFTNPEEQSNDFISNSDVFEKPLELMKSISNNGNTVSRHFQSSPSNPSLPLDLSTGTSSCQTTLDNEPSGSKISIHDSYVNSASIEPSQSLVKLDGITHEKVEETVTKTSYSDNEVQSVKTPSPRSPALEPADSKVLVDFANNTMKELLEIYGFEGQDSKSGILNNLRADNQTEFPSVDGKSYLGPLVKEEAGIQPAKTSKSKPSKSGVFRKNVYADLTDEASASSTDRAASNSPSGQEQAQNSADKVRSSQKLIKYAFSKKSYTQKVLNSTDFTKYIKRYETGAACGSKVCQDLGYREHYHCLDCPQKVFIRKEEMVRHYKWHKKRNDSLQHGFMRYSPMDDCSKKYGNCTHNGRQTHYHCVQRDCDKVYISTSDVQMHANFHRKDSAIIQEGFQRFRATEDCGTTYCAFYGQRTTHFHCRRPQCNFTFKNKADMEKHKSYHQKDEVLSRDGFKKFMKYEICPYTGCRYSKISNHIHCIRPGCHYVLHSTAQLYSHKRKHDRREFEHVYRSYRHLQQQQVTPASVKNELQNRVKSSLKAATEAALTMTNRTKILPLPKSASSLKLVSGVSTNKAMQRLHIGNSSTTSLISKAITKLDSTPPGSDLASKKPSLHTPFTHPTLGPEGVLNLSYKEGDIAMKGSEELRQTLTLPVKSLIDNSSTADVKPELKFEMERDSDPNDEPEDLSMPANKINSTFLKVENLREFRPQIKSEPDLPQQTSDNPISEDEDDYDDDDDDDDKDYGQVEEPTLVNTFSGSSEGEGDTFSDSLNLAIPPQARDNKQTSSVMADTRQTSSLKITEATKPVSVVGANESVIRAPAATVTEPSSSSHQDELQDQQQLQQAQTSQGVPQAIRTAEGKVLGVHIPIRLQLDRRERDESWKNYLVRYTANDACFSRCTCLYKDHYHCRTKGCQVVFKSKDGVRGHAKFHELQDSITPVVYHQYKSNTPCSSQECQYNCKEEHYHCNWTNCSHVIPAHAPTFSRLEHYRIHEYATSSLNKNRSSLSSAGSKTDLDPIQKRRGRPPKYPKYDLPVVPKVHLTEKEILDSTLAFIHNKISDNSKIVNGSRKFQASESCPDDQCVYKGKEHFHCGRKFCYTSTDRLDVLNLHAKDFHNNVTILEGYEFFERMVNCRRPACHNNKVNRHFHCVRPRCDYSFVRHSTMSMHNKKHPTVTSAVLSAHVAKYAPSQSKVVAPQYVPIAPAVIPSSSETKTPPAATITTAATASTSYSKTVKSSGTFFPLSSLKLGSAASPSPLHSPQIMSPVSRAQLLSTTPLASVTTAAAPAQIISGTPVFHTQNGTTIFSTGTLLTIPNLVTTSIPLLTQTPQGQQTNLVTRIIPVGQLAQHGLVSITGGQLIAAPQNHILQSSGGVLGASMVQVVQSPRAITSHTSSTLPEGSVATFSGTAPPLTVLVQQHQQLQHSSGAAPLNWAHLKKQMHYSVNLNCGRPFCKLKKKDHYHCLDCNQAFSDPSRLRAHISKHGLKFKKSDRGAKQSITTKFHSQGLASVSKPMDLSLEMDCKAESEADCNDDELSSSLNLQSSVFTSMVKHASPSNTQAVLTSSVSPSSAATKLTSNNNTITQAGKQQNSASRSMEAGKNHFSLSQMSDHKGGPDSPSLVIDEALDGSNESSLDASSSSLTLCSSLSRKSGRKRIATKNEDFVSTDSLMIPKPTKQRKIHVGVRSESDLPEGYKRVRCGEDCGHTRCAYRQTVTHFHCVRPDCSYGFSDKSRIIQHRIRHERLDALMGGEFQQYRASVTCERADCEFDEKASHFHCLKCLYSCADSSKVPAHRKYHTKLDNISSNGFTKYAGTSDCQTASCSYFRKQTHYHCMFAGCGHAVLGPSQMAPHKLKHAQHQSV